MKWAPDQTIIGNDFNYFYRITYNTPIVETNFSDYHSLQITDLRNYLNITEAELPVLHFTFLKTSNSDYLPIDASNTFSIYGFLKKVIIKWDSIFKENQELEKKYSELAKSIEHNKFEKDIYSRRKTKESRVSYAKISPRVRRFPF